MNHSTHTLYGVVPVSIREYLSAYRVHRLWREYFFVEYHTGSCQMQLKNKNDYRDHSGMDTIRVQAVLRTCMVATIHAINNRTIDYVHKRVNPRW